MRARRLSAAAAAAQDGEAEAAKEAMELMRIQQRQARQKLLLLPTSTFVTVWAGWIIGPLVVYTCIAVPLDVSFNFVTYMAADDLTAMFIVDRVVDVCFAIDMAKLQVRMIESDGSIVGFASPYDAPAPLPFSITAMTKTDLHFISREHLLGLLDLCSAEEAERLLGAISDGHTSILDSLKARGTSLRNTDANSSRDLADEISARAAEEPSGPPDSPDAKGKAHRTDEKVTRLPPLPRPLSRVRALIPRPNVPTGDARARAGGGEHRAGDGEPPRPGRSHPQNGRGVGAQTGRARPAGGGCCPRTWWGVVAAVAAVADG